MAGQLEELIERARHLQMSPQQQESQRRSFAYGSAAIENENVTRETIAAAANEMASHRVRIVRLDESADLKRE